MITFDLIALWTGRLILISIAWICIFSVWYWGITYMFRYSPAFRFAIFVWASQKAGKGIKVIEIKLYKSDKVYEFKELIK